MFDKDNLNNMTVSCVCQRIFHLSIIPAFRYIFSFFSEPICDFLQQKIRMKNSQHKNWKNDFIVNRYMWCKNESCCLSISKNSYQFTRQNHDGINVNEINKCIDPRQRRIKRCFRKKDVQVFLCPNQHCSIFVLGKLCLYKILLPETFCKMHL